MKFSLKVQIDCAAVKFDRVGILIMLSVFIDWDFSRPQKGRKPEDQIEREIPWQQTAQNATH